MPKKWSFIILTVLFILFLPERANCIRIAVSGTWLQIVDEDDVVGGPGGDLSPSYTSAIDQIVVSISEAFNARWRVDIRMSTGNWHGDLQVGVIRTSDGTGSPAGSITGGTSWITVTDTDQQFFTGRRDRSNINVQCRISGVSVAIPVDTYTTTVTYTVTEF